MLRNLHDFELSLKREKSRLRNIMWRRRNRDAARASSRKFYKKHKAKRLAYNAARSQSKKVLARKVFQFAVRIGFIRRPKYCPKCKRLPEVSKVQGHHLDYSEPLKVQWLCSACHGKLRMKHVA